MTGFYMKCNTGLEWFDLQTEITQTIQNSQKHEVKLTETKSLPEKNQSLKPQITEDVYKD